MSSTIFSTQLIQLTRLGHFVRKKLSQMCQLDDRSASHAQKKAPDPKIQGLRRAYGAARGLVILFLVVRRLLAHDGREQVVERAQILVDDIAVGSALSPADQLLVEVVARSGRGAEHDVGVGVGREDHVEQLRQILGIGLVVIRLEDVEQAVLLEAVRCDTPRSSKR